MSVSTELTRNGHANVITIEYLFPVSIDRIIIIIIIIVAGIGQSV